MNCVVTVVALVILITFFGNQTIPFLASLRRGEATPCACTSMTTACCNPDTKVAHCCTNENNELGKICFIAGKQNDFNSRIILPTLDRFVLLTAENPKRFVNKEHRLIDTNEFYRDVTLQPPGKPPRIVVPANS